MPRFLLDVRIAFRSLLRRPGFAVVAVLTLALGIGATTALYTVVQNVLLEPLPYPDSDRLVIVREKNPEAGFPVFSMSPLNFRDYRAEATSFEAFAASTGASLALEPPEGGPARRWSARQVTWEYFDVLAVPPILGRTFVESDDQPGAEPVIVLSYSAWQDLGGDRGILGTRLRIDGRATEVIGVMPDGFRGLTDAFVPLAVDYEETGRGGHWLTGMARLRPDVDLETATAELEAVAASLEATYPDSNTGWGAHVRSMKEVVVADSTSALWLLLAATGVVLLLACANVGHLTLTRLAEREREIALRSALGAGRWQVVRQLLVEGAVLAAVGCGAGLVLARFGTRWLVAIHENAIPRAEAIAMDGGVLAFALGVSIVSVLLFGLFPALQASKPNLAGTLKEGGRGFAGGISGGRLRSALVVFQVASAVVLAVGAGLLGRSLQSLATTDPGFRAEGVWTARLSLPESRYAENEERVAFYRRLVEETSALPGVEEAGGIMPMPLSFGGYVLQFFIDGRPLPEPNRELNSNIGFVLPGTFDALQIPLQTGRVFDESDALGTSGVVVVNRRAADRWWPDENPVGQRITFGDPRDEEEDEWMTVVGVVGDVRADELSSEPEPTFYLPMYQSPMEFVTLVVRSAGEPAAVSAGLREAVERIDPAVPLWAEQPAETIVHEAMADSRFVAALLGSFAGLALLLAVVGVFGVVSYGVTRGRREIGVRRALGAGSLVVARHVLATALGPVGFGVLVGLFGAWGASRWLESLVHGVGTTDPATYSSVAALLVLAGVLASAIPTLRAVRVDPVRVLREE